MLKVMNAARRAHRRAAAQYAAHLRHGDEEEIQKAECILEEAALVLAAATLGAAQRQLRKDHGMKGK